MTQYIKKLPAVFQTVTEKKFFDATFDQVFSKKDSDYLSGFIGRRNPGSFDPLNDFYFPEPSKNRTWWQLEATAFARNEDTTKSNVFFYDDLLENTEYYGGNTLNQDRLFNSEYYSFGPPIDYDMFINYQDYYWIEQGLPAISIYGVMASDIIGQTSYTTPDTATPPNFTLSSGMTIILEDDPDYAEPFYVENMGGCTDSLSVYEGHNGLQLIEPSSDFTAGTQFEFLPWDGIIELSNGRSIDNRFWDMLTWDTQVQPLTGDYITIQRGSLTKNAWSRTNKWFHIDTIKAVLAITDYPFPKTATRALRPIIQFLANLELYKSGTRFNTEIKYGFYDDVVDQPILFSDVQGQNVSIINPLYGIDLKNDDLVVFFNDTTEIDINLYPWDTFDWDTIEWDGVLYTARVNRFIFKVTILDDGTIEMSPHTSWETPVEEGDIVIATEDAPANGAKRGESWYYSNGTWQRAFNDKTRTNQAPLFQLYDHNGVPLDDETTYPGSSFGGSKIFSYKINPTPGATVDPVLRFPIVYSGLGQASDIVFQNNLMVDRYIYGPDRLDIDGYYYYKVQFNPVLYNNWNLYDPCACDDIVPPPPCNCIDTSKQRVIDKFVVGFGSEYQYRLSVTPYGYVFGAGASQPSADVVVSVNGVEVKSILDQINGYTFIEINNRVYIDLTVYVSGLLTQTLPSPPVVEVQTYTHEMLDPAAPGYSAIPQQLEANPNQDEVFEITGSELTQHFTSIIAAQIGFTGVAFGGTNNFRDTRKNRSVGSFILQNVSPLLKTMLVSPQGDLSFIDSVRFSQNEYTQFKSKYLRTAQQLINQEFNPVQYKNKTVVISAWVEEILKLINVSKEFSNSFAYSYMIANGTPNLFETHTVPVGSLLLDNYVNLNDLRNSLYVYDITGHEKLLTLGYDYNIVSSNLTIELEFTANVPVGNSVYVAMYKNPIPAYVPSTPTKLGLYPTYVPRIELDTSYAEQNSLEVDKFGNPLVPYPYVLIGHDGSKAILFGDYDPLTGDFTDYRDALLLELETRIYNLLQQKFRNEYSPFLRIESVKEGYFNKERSRYSRNEYLKITESYLNKWTTKNKANFRANDWLSSKLIIVDSSKWKLYNYTDAINSLGDKLNLPGNWKGIFQYMYDTYYPDTRPWEMLGLSEKPQWWEFEYGPGVLNTEGQQVWTNTAAGNNDMWADLEAGIIRQGPSAIYNPVTEIAQPQIMWARPGLSAYIPVDAAGEIVPVPILFDIPIASDDAPFDGFDKEWVYGDGAPVEQAWMSTSSYAFSVQEFMFLMKPAMYGELMWDTVGTELSPGYISVPDSDSNVRSNQNWQYVQNDTYDSSNPLFAWMRPKNADQQVHAENVDGETIIRFGYQRWISDRLLFAGKDITSTFGHKVRTLNVNLANKLAGFTNRDTTNTYIESISPGSSTTSLIVPSTNFDVLLHKSPVVDTFSYSGVIIRALEDGTFAVYGYDLLNSEFTVFDRSDSKLIDVTVGGTPAEFLFFTPGNTYNEGTIVRYNGVYYVSLVTQTPQKFEPSGWQRLRGLPIVGGISVSYKPVSESTTTKIPYGTVLKNPQAVFDMLIGWGAYLESRGWKFNEVNQETNQLSDWLASAKQFLFWLNSNWAPDASIQLSPIANKATLVVNRGYPNDIEKISNGVYSILDKYGIAIAPESTATDRDGRMISVEPADLATGGIYFLQVNVSETEHVLIFDNSTSFNDIVYSPLLRARQQRIKFNGFRTNNWYGKMEAPGYLVVDNQLVPNFDTIVESMRYFYDPNYTIDNPSLEDLGRHLIGYESKSYLDNLEVSNDVQYLFYKGVIRQKGTQQAFDKLFRSTKIQSDENIEIFEEWALKLADFGNTVEQVSTEFVLTPEQNTGEVVVARLNFVPSDIGFVRQVNIFNAETRYTVVPTILIGAPTAGTPDDRRATGYVVLDHAGRISRIDITDHGYGYLTAPDIAIVSPQPIGNDRLYAIWQGQIEHDVTLDNIVDIDIDETNVWLSRPTDAEYSLEFPLTSNVDYPIPNAGYVHSGDVNFQSFDPTQTAVNWGTLGLDPIKGDTIWIAKTFTEDWGVYKLVDVAPEFFDVIADENNGLYLRTNESFLIQPELSGGTVTTDFGNMLVFQAIEEETEAVVLYTPPTEQATATTVVNTPARAVATVDDITGAISATVVDSGSGYFIAPPVTISAPIRSNAYASADVINGQVTDIRIVSTGRGYDSNIGLTTVTVSPPVIVNATAESTIASGSVLAISVITNGQGYFGAPPTVIIEPPTAPISPPGVVAATATATLFGGRVVSITITNPGAGYTSVPKVFIGPPTVSTATAIVSAISETGVAEITVTSPGLGYFVAPQVTITPANGIQATANSTLLGDTVTSINMINPGSGYTTLPSITVGTPPNSGEIQSVTVTNPGMYTSKPNVTVVGSGIGAELDAVWDPVTKEVTAINVISSGINYSNVSIVVDPPDPLPNINNIGQVVGIEIVNEGAGYDKVPTMEIYDSAKPEAIANIVGNQIESITIVSPGYGYTSTPIISIVGDGVGATAVAVIENYKIVEITVTNEGTGYTTASVVIPENYSSYGFGASAQAIILNGSVIGGNIISQGSGYIKPAVRFSAPTNLKPKANYALGFSFDRTEDGINYYELLTLDGEQISSDQVGDYEEFNRLMLFKTMRFMDLSPVSSVTYMDEDEKFWVDGYDYATDTSSWKVYQYKESLDYLVFREQERLINTNLFQSASIFDVRTKNKLALLPVYDPFKNILPGPAIQNVTYMALKDPARYNVTPDETLFSSNIIFSEAQVGQLWWDLSSTRYMYYEQPMALDGSETPTDNLVYRRDNWGNLFPGSSIDIYEWVRSSVPPIFYRGTGTPRDTSTYVQVRTSDRFSNETVTLYYFWVLNATDLPNKESRTLAASNVSLLLQSPKTQNFAFFAPIQETEINNSYMFYNVQETLAYRGDNIQIRYRLSERDDQEHTQWMFFRDGDTFSKVTPQYWNKLVDSLCGYTKPLPLSDEYDNSILVETSPDVFEEVLPVPDPALGEAEKYGILYRPRQSMFTRLVDARKIFVQSANELLQYIPIRDDNPSWNTGVNSSVYWEYTNWYKEGYEDVEPDIAFQTLAEANAALTDGQLQVGDIVQVIDGTSDNRFVMYVVMQINPNISVLSLDEVCIENSAVKLLDTIYTVSNRYNLSVELRELLDAFRTQVMVDENEVDQNRLYFSMLNYVLSEQKNPDWVFKSSYITIKENNLPLLQSQLYVPDKTDNVLQYIRDVKPYHTQIRDYTNRYVLSDLAFGTAFDFYKIKATIQFGPRNTTYQTPFQNSISALGGWDFNQGVYKGLWQSIQEVEGRFLVNSLWDELFWAPDETVLWESEGEYVQGNIVVYDGNLFVANKGILPVDNVTFNPVDWYYYLPAPATAMKWQAGIPYNQGSLVIYYNYLYRANAYISAANNAVWNPAFWDLQYADSPANTVPYATGNQHQAILNQFISGNPVLANFAPNPGDPWPDVITAPIVNYEPSRRGYSNLYPYTIGYSEFTLDDPQSFVAPENIIAVQIGASEYLTYGRDYYGEYNEDDNSYTLFFYEDPSTYPMLNALMWVNGGSIQNITFNTYRNELAVGFPKDNFVVNVDTKLVVNDVSEILDAPWSPKDYSPLCGWGDIWEAITDPAISQALNENNGMTDIPWDVPIVPVIMDYTISYKENLNIDDGAHFVRNAEEYSGILVNALTSPTATDENLDVIVVQCVDDILPPPGAEPGVIWIEGERIEYRMKTLVDGTIDTWELRLVRRSTMGTSATAHAVLIPSLEDPLVMIPNPVWVERSNVMSSNSDITMWNAINSMPDPTTEGEPGEFTNVSNVPLGGLWYAQTQQATFLKQGPGVGIP